MNVQNFIEKLDLKVLIEGDLSLPVTGCYCGDLLSWVMSRAKDPSDVVPSSSMGAHPSSNAGAKVMESARSTKQNTKFFRQRPYF